MSDLTLAFRENDISDRYSRVDWPPDMPRLQAYFGTSRKAAIVNVSFIMANTPPGHKIYFVSAAFKDYEHENMKERLKSFGERFEERIEKRVEKKAGFFRSSKVERAVQFIFGSTSDREVVRSVFDNYISWELGTPFIFLIAKEEPPKWKEVVDIMSAGHPYPKEFVLKTHCLMRTVVDDGMFIASTELTQDEVILIASRVARQLTMDLTIRSFPTHPR